MMKLLSLGILTISVAACGVASSDDAPASSAPPVCDPGLDGQRIAVNGAQLNGIQQNRIAVNGTAVVGVRVAGSPAVGASVSGVLADGSTVDLLVASAEDGAYELTRNGANICEEGTKGIFVPGVWDATGARHDSDTLKTFACASGVIAKCVAWGYAPERVGAAMHQACTRMARADYCGDGVPHTRDGTAIDVSDARGIVAAANEADFLFEAGWNENGAVCVSRPRFEGARPSCWADLPTCASREDAAARGAVVMNASRSTCQ